MITVRHFNEEEHFVIATCFKTHAFGKLRLIDYCSIKRVCKLWQQQMHIQDLDLFKIISFPLFKRFVSGLTKIDRTATPKYASDRDGNGLITQQNYENQMILLAAQAAVKGYSLFNKFDISLTPTEVNQLVNNTEKVMFKYYEKPTQIFPKYIYLPKESSLLQFSDLKLKVMTLSCFFNKEAFSTEKHSALRELKEILVKFKIISENDLILTQQPSIWKTYAKVLAQIVTLSVFLSFLLFKFHTLANTWWMSCLFLYMLDKSLKILERFVI